jgi:hypothetical protein
MGRMSIATFSKGSPCVHGPELDLVCGEAKALSMRPRPRTRFVCGEARLDNPVENGEGRSDGRLWWQRRPIGEHGLCELWITSSSQKLQADATATTAGGLGGGGAPVWRPMFLLPSLTLMTGLQMVNRGQTKVNLGPHPGKLTNTP